MKTFLSVLTFALLVPASLAFAEESTAGLTLADKARGAENKADVSIVAEASERNVTVSASASSTASVNDADQDDDATTTREDKGKGDDNVGTSTSVMHRSAVASFVQSLLSVADRDGGIGEEVRAVAESQNDAASTTAEAIQKVEKRGKFMTFLFGTDWKNIGTLRSQIAKTETDEARLETALSQTADASVKADLSAQLSALKAEQAKVQAFVDTHAKSFSLFGWFTKLFVSANTSTSTNSQ